MKTYKIKYIIQTKSRAGAYNYSYTDIYEAETEEAAKTACKESAASKTMFKRFKVIIRNVEEI